MLRASYTTMPEDDLYETARLIIAARHVPSSDDPLDGGPGTPSSDDPLERGPGSPDSETASCAPFPCTERGVRFMGEGVLQMESLSGLRGAASASSVSFTGGASSCGCSAPFQCAIPRDLSLEPAALSTRASKSISRAWTLRRDLCASFSARVNSSSRLCWSSASARVVRNFCSQSAQRPARVDMRRRPHPDGKERREALGLPLIPVLNYE